MLLQVPTSKLYTQRLWSMFPKTPGLLLEDQLGHLKDKNATRKGLPEKACQGRFKLS